MKYYAEFDTDKIIREKYFPNYDYKGLIIEVGGATPEFLSMSKHFKDNGWRTIIIEPNPTFAQQHIEIGNEVYQFACSYEDKDGEFTIVEQQVSAYGGIVTDHSFSSIEVKDSYLRKTNFNLTNSNSKKINVKIKKLDTILNEINISKIDILSIDVEGWEIEVMKGLNTENIDCKLIVVENFLDDDSYKKYFESIGYYLSDNIQYNQIYLKK
jgi:FkbM family methyltransferase